MKITKGTRFIDRFTKSETFGRTGIVVEIDGDGDYWCFFPNCALGYNVKDEDYDTLDELGIDEFGTMGYAFKEWMELV